MLDVDKIAVVIRERVAGMLSPLAARIKSLEDRPLAKDGTNGIDGKDALPVDYEVVATLVDKAVARIPVPQNGKDGAPGRDGHDGMAGKDGAPGIQGERGNDGTNGKDGNPGRDGEPGKPGDPGEKGADGKDGINGKDGADGLTGKDGDPGERGADGSNGINGKDGADGINGKDGSDGLTGKDGAPGERGADGSNGINGKDGADGINGKDGSDGLNGKDGGDGINGKDGADGINGKEGAPGKDVDYEVVAKMLTDAIERAIPDIIGKSVALIPKPLDGRDGVPGRDGIGTKGEDGTNGRDGLSVDDFDLSTEDDGRTIVVTLRAGDREIRKSITIPVPLDRGVFKAGPYLKGDGVTHGGSFWIAQRSVTAEDIPGRSDAWRLAVKRGTDAK